MGDTDTTAVAPQQIALRRRMLAYLRAAVAAGAVLAAGIGIGLTIRSGPATPGDGSPEAGFARDMQTHHAQAVDMSMLAYQRATDPTVRIMAYDIALTQQAQVGMMRDWLDQWQLSQTATSAPMAWMAADHGPSGLTMRADGRMPGMATDAELAQLRTLTGRPFDVLYCQLMIRHHLGGIMMVDGALKRSHTPAVTALVSSMKTGQQGEITALTQLLAGFGATPS